MSIPGNFLRDNSFMNPNKELNSIPTKKFITIENSEGSFTINIDDISGLMKYNSKESMMFGGPRSGEIFHTPERYMVETRNHKFGITEKKYKDILRMIADEGL